MRSLKTEIVTWEELKHQFIVNRRKRLLTGSPVVDDILNRFVFWAHGPMELQSVVKRFTFGAAEDDWSKYSFTIYEFNFLKWYVGQYISAMPNFPDRWDEKLDNVTSPKELAEFIRNECIPNCIDPL